MPPPGIALSGIGPESDALLRNLFEHYCHDMSEWFDVDTGTDGLYSYDTASIWTKDYRAYLATIGASIAGFAVIGPAAEWLGDVSAHDVHEFFVMRRFRRRGVGQRMATLLWNRHPGEWLVRVFEANAPAVHFWRNAISACSMGSYQETGRVIDGRSWRFFRFVAPGPAGNISDIRPAELPQDLSEVRSLFREYAASLNIDLCFQGFEVELAGLPGKYNPPEGRLLLAWTGTEATGKEAVGCVALRPLEGTACEMKRLYVRPQARGGQLGRRLAERICEEARSIGYSRICLDTLPGMVAALKLYTSLGFKPIGPYVFNPVPGAIFLELEL
jgi:predicted acetyltransferase